MAAVMLLTIISEIVLEGLVKNRFCQQKLLILSSILVGIFPIM